MCDVGYFGAVYAGCYELLTDYGEEAGGGGVDYTV